MAERRSTPNWLGPTLALFDSLVFAGLVAALLWRAVPDQNRELVAAAAGFVAGWVAQYRNFLTGTTVGDQAKTQALADNAKTLRTAGVGGPSPDVAIEADNVNVNTPSETTRTP